jgi:erythromycin esterase-like protein
MNCRRIEDAVSLRSTIDVYGSQFSANNELALGGALRTFLRRLDHAPRLLGFGEAMHGEEAFPELRNQMFRHLVEHEGYRSIAIESSCIRSRVVDTFVQGGGGSLDLVMEKGFSHGFGNSLANHQLVQWMADYNRHRPQEEKLRFFGFDAPIEMRGADSPGETLSFLATYLTLYLGGNELPGTLERIGSLVGDNDRWTNPAAALDPSQSVGGSQDVKELRLIAEDLLTLLASEAPRLLVDSSQEELWEAELHGRSAAGLLAYHAAMADNSTQRVSRLLAIRDKLMADNLYSLTELEMR